LHDKHIAAAHVIVQLYGYFAIGKLRNGNIAKWLAKMINNYIHEIWIYIAGKDQYVIQDRYF